jgi:hypothetical protein
VWPETQSDGHWHGDGEGDPTGPPTLRTSNATPAAATILLTTPIMLAAVSHAWRRAGAAICVNAA